MRSLFGFLSCPLGLMLHKRGGILEKHHYEKAEAVVLGLEVGYG